MNVAEKYMLLAEDDLMVAELVVHALAQRDPPPRLVHVRDGVETLDYLYSRGRYANRHPVNPAVILLDVKMPKLDGIEVLRQIKSDDALKVVPVVMLTSSQDERDVRESYHLGANAYVVKPVEFRNFATVLRQLEIFWLQVNHSPPGTRADTLAAGAK